MTLKEQLTSLEFLKTVMEITIPEEFVEAVYYNIVDVLKLIFVQLDIFSW